MSQYVTIIVKNNAFVKHNNMLLDIIFQVYSPLRMSAFGVKREVFSHRRPDFPA